MVLLLNCHCKFFFFEHVQCNRTVAFSALFNQVFVEPTKLALIGSGCSVATEPSAEISQFYNITQVSNGNAGNLATSLVVLSNKFLLLASHFCNHWFI